MYVCICNAITDKQIREAVQAGAEDLWDLKRELGVASNCGRCKEQAMDVLRDEARAGIEPAVYSPAAG